MSSITQNTGHIICLEKVGGSHDPVKVTHAEGSEDILAEGTGQGLSWCVGGVSQPWDPEYFRNQRQCWGYPSSDFTGPCGLIRPATFASVGSKPGSLYLVELVEVLPVFIPSASCFPHLQHVCAFLTFSAMTFPFCSHFSPP